MQRYLDLSTQGKLLTAFGLLILFMLAVIGFSWNALATMREAQRTLLDSAMATVVDLKDIRGNQHGIRANVAQMLAGVPPDQAHGLRENVLARHREIEEELRRIAERGSLPGRRELLRDFTALQVAAIQLREAQVLPLLAAGKVEEARPLVQGVQQERYRRLGQMADDLVEHAVKTAGGLVAEADQEAGRTMRLLALLAVAALVVAAALTALLTRVLADPLRTLSRAAERLAAGDLTVEVAEASRRDEAGVLGRTFRQMVQRLRDSMRETGDGIAVLAASASEITASTAQVAASSAETASAVAQTSATAEEVKQTAQVASDKAAQVQQAAEKAAHASGDGLRSMDESIEAMHQIRQQMDAVAQSILRLADQGMAIGEIINTVTDLADQSNLLSVNAAIEAARAGEEGAGFRVVAQEIRSLAEQSRQATVQVRGLLGDIQKATSGAVMATEEAGKTVRTGVRLSETAAQALRTMAAMVQEAARAAAQIAASAQQQAVGMDQVAYAMHNISQASAQNVAASRQTEAAAQGLQDLGQRLKAMIDQYQYQR